MWYLKGARVSLHDGIDHHVRNRPLTAQRPFEVDMGLTRAALTFQAATLPLPRFSLTCGAQITARRAVTAP